MEHKDNVINGGGDSSKAGIYVKDGNGVIDGNTLVDADGGILIDGVRFGYTANVTNNDISQTAGRQHQLLSVSGLKTVVHLLSTLVETTLASWRTQS